MRVSQSWRQPFPPSHTHTNPHIHTQTLLALQINTSKTQTFVPAVRGKSLATGTNEVPLDSWPPICYCIFSMHSCQLSIGCFAVSGHWFMKKLGGGAAIFWNYRIKQFLPSFKDANPRRLALLGGGWSLHFSHLFIFFLLFRLLLFLYFSEGAGWGGMYLHSRHTWEKNSKQLIIKC